MCSLEVRLPAPALELTRTAEPLCKIHVANKIVVFRSERDFGVRDRRRDSTQGRCLSGSRACSDASCVFYLWSGALAAAAAPVGCGGAAAAFAADAEKHDEQNHVEEELDEDEVEERVALLVAVERAVFVNNRARGLLVVNCLRRGDKAAQQG